MNVSEIRTNLLPLLLKWSESLHIKGSRSPTAAEEKMSVTRQHSEELIYLKDLISICEYKLPEKLANLTKSYQILQLSHNRAHGHLKD